MQDLWRVTICSHQNVPVEKDLMTMKQNKRVVRISYIKNHFAIKFSNATAVICKEQYD